MAGRTHLFFAMSHYAFGEVALALRLAWELHAEGDHAIFLTPSGQDVLLRGTPFKHGHIDAVWGAMDQVLPGVIADKRCDSLVVVDAASVFLALAVAHIDPGFLRGFDVPVIAFDVWNLPETDLTWDTGAEPWRLPRAALDLERRLCPVPFIRPEPAPGRYNALPADPRAPGVPDRDTIRAELGLADGAKLLVTTTASWQTQRAAISPYHARLIGAVSELLSSHLARLGDHVRVLHVGPEPLAGADAALGARYRHAARVPAPRMAGLLGAADLCVSLNASATTISTAIALGLPVVLATSSVDATTADEAAARLPAPSSARVAALLPRLLPLRPFSVWPLGLHDFLAPVLRDNPYLDALTRVELLDEDAFVTACTRLVDDAPAREQAQGRMAEYRRLVALLPSAAAVFRGYL